LHVAGSDDKRVVDFVAGNPARPVSPRPRRKFELLVARACGNVMSSSTEVAGAGSEISK
jgi:hypothetical protein